MTWYKFNEKRPFISKDWFNDEHQDILVRIKDPAYSPKYYVVYGEIRHGSVRYIESSGEQYSWWDEDELEAWTPLEEIDKDFEQSNT